jgi:predicted DNA-binding protein
MSNQNHRFSVTLQADSKAIVDDLMSKTRRRQNVIIREAIEKGLQQMQQEQKLLEQMRP